MRHGVSVAQVESLLTGYSGERASLAQFLLGYKAVSSWPDLASPPRGAHPGLG